MSARGFRRWSAGGPLEDFAVHRSAWVHDTGRALILHGECVALLGAMPAHSVDAAVTDPPYGVKEFEPEELVRKRAGRGGVWRIPPRIGGSERAPLPRFTVLSAQERAALSAHFTEWSAALLRVLKPGAHAFVAGNSLLALDVFHAIALGGLEYRGSVLRLVRTLRGGNRPKGAEAEFPGVCTLPRSCHEPWGIFRAPLPAGMTVAQCLRTHGTGALRRDDDGTPFDDVIQSARTPRREREIAAHPSLKPQAWLRTLVRASLPMGDGVVLDPFMGSGSTLAAALALGAKGVGIERDAKFATLARRSVNELAGL